MNIGVCGMTVDRDYDEVKTGNWPFDKLRI